MSLDTLVRADVTTSACALRVPQSIATVGRQEELARLVAPWGGAEPTGRVDPPLRPRGGWRMSTMTVPARPPPTPERMSAQDPLLRVRPDQAVLLEKFPPPSKEGPPTMTFHLDDDQVEHFLQRGYVILEGCFSAEDAQPWVDRAWTRLGYDRDDPSSWAEPRVHLSSKAWVDTADFAPKALDAACELLGGAERADLPWRWSDGMIANLGVGADRPFQPPSADVEGWHKDGDFFRHFLDSPEQGLLTIVLWSDVVSQGGGTFLAADSVPVVARLLADHPEGLLPDEFDFQALVRECHDFVEITGNLGDVVLIHPYTLHATSQNVLRRQRLITNPPLALNEPMRFDRQDPSEFSLVERAILRGLGVDRLDFRPTGPREDVVPERVRLQALREQAEEQRLAAVGSGAGSLPGTDPTD